MLYKRLRFKYPRLVFDSSSFLKRAGFFKPLSLTWRCLSLTCRSAIFWAKTDPREYKYYCRHYLDLGLHLARQGPHSSQISPSCLNYYDLENELKSPCKSYGKNEKGGFYPLKMVKSENKFAELEIFIEATSMQNCIFISSKIHAQW